MKKFLAVVLALVMAVSMTTVAFAADVADESSLKTAVGNGGEIKLTADITLTDGLEIASDKTVTIDLAGKTLSYASSETTGNAAITNYGTLTIKDSVGGGKVTYSSTQPSAGNAYGTNTISNEGGTLTVESGTIENTTSGGASFAIDNNNSLGETTVTINGGSIIASGFAIRQVAFSTAVNKVVINGGSVTGQRAVSIQLTGTDAAVTPPVALSVNGGTLTAVPYTSGGYTYDMAIYAYSSGSAWSDVDIDITGGTFDGEIALGGGQKNGAASLDITGGTFQNKVYTYGTLEDIDISGGTFTVSPADEYLAADATFDSTTGKVTVPTPAPAPSYGYAAPSGHYVTSPFDGVDKVYVDGALVDAKNYTTSGGNITLLQSYLDGLTNGKHNIKIVYGTREATGTFEVAGNKQTVESAKTFDAGIALYAGMALSSAFGAAYVMKKR